VLDVCVVPHTHWDREWYHGAARFRQRLVALMDALLAADGTPDAPPGPFLLDGQAVTLRDYLRVRPERLVALQQALTRGLLEAGPWYVLADNLMPSGEALVRNLAAGRRVLHALGATAPAVAYCPDTFGHPAALPTVAEGFGLTVGVVWRGYGGADHPAGDTFWWTAPSGARLLTAHLPPDGYEYGSALPADAASAQQRWDALEALWRARTATGLVLLLNGADHHARQPDLAEALDALRAAARARNAGHVVRHTSLSAWAAQLRERAASLSLPTVTGELRDSYGYTWTLAGTLGTRAHQKRVNARLERGLLHDVEPWLALARIATGRRASRQGGAVAHDGQLTMAQLPALLHCAWEDLLETHPHDTLCGCSVDAVAHRMDVVQGQVADQGRGLRDAALSLLLQHDVVAARARRDFDWRRVVLRNRTSYARGGVAELRLIETIADEAVGPGSSAASQPSLPHDDVPDLLGTWCTQRLSQRLARERRESPQHYPDNDIVREHRVLAWVPPVPALGLAVYDRETLGATRSKPPVPVTASHQDDRILVENGLLQLTVDAAHTVSLTQGGRTISDLLWLETQRDAGDSYTPSLRGTVERLHCLSATLVHAGPLRALVRLTWATGASSSAPVGARVPRRVTARARVRATTDLVIDAASPIVACHISGHNRRRNHRLRLVWRTDVADGEIWADAAFGPVRRFTPSAHRPAPSALTETVVPTIPMHRWVSHLSPISGAAMFSDGLAEAQVEPHRLSLTLVRAVGALSRNDLPERPGHAGWPAATPEAQCIGPFEARTALLLHDAWSDATVRQLYEASDALLLPLVGRSWRDLDSRRSGPACAGPALSGEAFVMSAVTVAETDANTIVLRAVNVTNQQAPGAWTMPDRGPWLVTPCRLDETPTGESYQSDAHIGFVAAPRALVTFSVRRVQT
jgi:alpha-mannosidase